MIHRSNTFYYRFEYIGDMDYLKSYLILFTSSTKVKVIEPSKIQVVLQKSTRLEYLCMLSLRLKNLRDPLFKEAREGIIEFKVFWPRVDRVVYRNTVSQTVTCCQYSCNFIMLITMLTQHDGASQYQCNFIIFST